MATSLNSSPLYRVALIGKPNVGKSSLFNQLTGTNNSIVTAKRGVTRDTLNTVVKYQNDAMLLSDLAGWDTNFFERVDVTPSNRDEVTLGKKMSSKIDETLANCDLLVVVLDLKDITAEDYQLKVWLEGLSQPKVICVNKFDRDKDAAYLGEIYELFQDEMVLVSAKNKLKLNELKKKIFAEKAKLFAAGVKPRNSETSQREYDYTLSIVGRPNAGKSSLLNALLQKERAIVSDIAGTTRDIIHDYFEYHHKVFKILDTAGLKKKAKVKSRLENYANQKTIHAVNQSDLTILLVDAMVGITDQDKKIISFCKTKRKAMLVVINKWDLVKDKEQVDYFKYLLDIEPLLNKFPLLKVSCKNRRNFSKILENVYNLLKKQSIELVTHDLNTTIQSATSRKAPPNKNGRSLKIYYAVQSLNRPPKLLLYVNSSSLINKTYDSYLHNFIEKHYGLQGVPFSLSYVDKAEQAEK